MSFTSYGALKTSVADWLNRADLTAQVPDFITLAEAEITERVDHPDMVVVKTVSITGETLSKPCDFDGVLSLRINSDCVRSLKFITMEQMDDEPIAANGVPHKYTIAGGKFVFSPFPDDDADPVTGRLRYRSKICLLSENGTNWVLEQYPAAYLYGALKHSAPFLQDDPRVAVWSSLFDQAIDTINNAGRRQSLGASLQTRSGVAD
jgi:hypothetical protein